MVPRLPGINWFARVNEEKRGVKDISAWIASLTSIACKKPLSPVLASFQMMIHWSCSMKDSQQQITQATSRRIASLMSRCRWGRCLSHLLVQIRTSYPRKDIVSFARVRWQGSRTFWHSARFARLLPHMRARGISRSSVSAALTALETHLSKLQWLSRYNLSHKHSLRIRRLKLCRKKYHKHWKLMLQAIKWTLVS